MRSSQNQNEKLDKGDIMNGQGQQAPPQVLRCQSLIHEMQCFSRTAQAISDTLSQTRLKCACSRHEELCGAWGRAVLYKPKTILWRQIPSASLGFLLCLCLHRACSEQNQHLFINYVAGDSD